MAVHWCPRVSIMLSMNISTMKLSALLSKSLHGMTNTHYLGLVVTCFIRGQDDSPLHCLHPPYACPGTPPPPVPSAFPK